MNKFNKLLTFIFHLKLCKLKISKKLNNNKNNYLFIKILLKIKILAGYLNLQIIKILTLYASMVKQELARVDK